MGCTTSSPLVPNHNGPTANGMRTNNPPSYDLNPTGTSMSNNGFLSAAKNSWTGFGDNMEGTINSAAENVKQTFTSKFHEAEEKLDDTVSALRKDIADAISGRKEELDEFQDRVKADASGLDGEARDMVDSLNSTTESLSSPFLEKIKNEEKPPEDYMPRVDTDEMDDMMGGRGGEWKEGDDGDTATADEYGMRISSPPIESGDEAAGMYSVDGGGEYEDNSGANRKKDTENDMY